MLDYINLLWQTLLSFIVLFILTKMIGYRQISQLSLFDYINGITIGSIAAEMATELESNPVFPLTAMVLYGIFTIIVSRLTAKSIKARRFITGEPMILLNNGLIYKKNLVKARMNLNEFLEECRISGYFSVSDLQTAILESNGKISFIPKADKKPLTPEDMNLSPDQEYLNANVILDGHIMEKNLRHAGKDRNWLDKKLKGYGVNGPEEVLLATHQAPDDLQVYPQNAGEDPSDILD